MQIMLINNKFFSLKTLLDTRVFDKFSNSIFSRTKHLTKKFYSTFLFARRIISVNYSFLSRLELS